MPRNVRNFWIDVDVDGRSGRMSGGPSSKDGGMSAHLKVRDAGTVRDALTINAHAFEDGKLQINVFDGDGELLHTLITSR